MFYCHLKLLFLFLKSGVGNNGGKKRLEIPLMLTMLQFDYCLFSLNSVCSFNLQKAYLTYPAKCRVFFVSVVVKHLRYNQKLNGCDLKFPNIFLTSVHLLLYLLTRYPGVSREHQKLQSSSYCRSQCESDIQVSFLQLEIKSPHPMFM